MKNNTYRQIKAITSALIALVMALCCLCSCAEMEDIEKKLSEIQSGSEAEEDEVIRPAKVNIKDSFTSTKEAVRLSWEKNRNVEGYRIYQQVGDEWSLVKDVSSSVSSFRISGLDPDTEYKFRMTAYVQSGMDKLEGYPSNVVETRTKKGKKAETSAEPEPES